jgi:hypothetical protein
MSCFGLESTFESQINKEWFNLGQKEMCTQESNDCIHYSYIFK